MKEPLDISSRELMYRQRLWVPRDWLYEAHEAEQRGDIKEAEYLLNLGILLARESDTWGVALECLRQFYKRHFETLYLSSTLSSSSGVITEAQRDWRYFLTLSDPSLPLTSTLRIFKNRLKSIYDERQNFLLSKYPALKELQAYDPHEASTSAFFHKDIPHQALQEWKRTQTEIKSLENVSPSSKVEFKRMTSESAEEEFHFPLREVPSVETGVMMKRSLSPQFLFILDRDDTMLDSKPKLINEGKLISFLQRLSVRPYAQWGIASTGAISLKDDPARQLLTDPKNNIQDPLYTLLTGSINGLNSVLYSLNGVSLYNPERTLLKDPTADTLILCLSGEMAPTSSSSSQSTRIENKNHGSPLMRNLAVEIQEGATATFQIGKTHIVCDVLTLRNNLQTLAKGDYKLFLVLALLDEAGLTLNLNDFPELVALGIRWIESPPEYSYLQRGHLVFCDDKSGCVALLNKGFTAFRADTESAHEQTGTRDTYLKELNDQLKIATTKAGKALSDSLHQDRMILFSKIKKLIVHTIELESYQISRISRGKVTYAFVGKDAQVQKKEVSKTVGELLKIIEEVSREDITSKEGVSQIKNALKTAEPVKMSGALRGKLFSQTKEENLEKTLYDKIRQLLEIHDETGVEHLGAHPPRDPSAPGPSDPASSFYHH